MSRYSKVELASGIKMFLSSEQAPLAINHHSMNKDIKVYIVIQQPQIEP